MTLGRQSQIGPYQLFGVEGGLLRTAALRVLLGGCHILVRTDNTTAVSYIDRQGGLRSLTLHVLARELILWCDSRLLSVIASHVPGLWNRGADLLSREHCHYAEWALHPAVAAQTWAIFGRPQVDLFTSEEDAKCPLFFSMRKTASLGLNALSYD